ncbi:hypothetical protein AB0H77_18070 [Streptomyces sp. NPDC050844]|uniref:hypothetical protein n=1 Tax=Streptomyces sp. NPDC050844 TaxID=3155790 RepID=UPI003409E20F
MNPRLIALMGVVAITVLLPFAGASAGPVGDDDAGAGQAERPTDPVPSPDAKQPSKERLSSNQSAPERPNSNQSATEEPSLLSGLGLSSTARCGPELTSPEGIEAQTCVLTQRSDTWARTYYRNATGDELSAVLTVMAPGGRTVQMHCAVSAEDEPGVCETPRERTEGNAAAYSAVVEFADGSGGPLLLRSGSNSARPKVS